MNNLAASMYCEEMYSDEKRCVAKIWIKHVTKEAYTYNYIR